jgi:hypothetical protein
MKARLYWVLFAVESVCAAAVLYSGVPLYRALLKGPGPDEPAHEVLLKTAIAVVLMQASYWSRRRVRPAGLKRRVLLAHLLMFTSRLSFVFAGSLLPSSSSFVRETRSSPRTGSRPARLGIRPVLLLQGAGSAGRGVRVATTGPAAGRSRRKLDSLTSHHPEASVAAIL